MDRFEHARIYIYEVERVTVTAICRRHYYHQTYQIQVAIEIKLISYRNNFMIQVHLIFHRVDIVHSSGQQTIFGVILVLD